MVDAGRSKQRLLETAAGLSRFEVRLLGGPQDLLHACSGELLPPSVDNVASYAAHLLRVSSATTPSLRRFAGSARPALSSARVVQDVLGLATVTGVQRRYGDRSCYHRRALKGCRMMLAACLFLPAACFLPASKSCPRY